MVNKTWHLVEQHGCWWAYEGELPPAGGIHDAPPLGPPAHTRPLSLASDGTGAIAAPSVWSQTRRPGQPLSTSARVAILTTLKALWLCDARYLFGEKADRTTTGNIAGMSQAGHKTDLADHSLRAFEQHREVVLRWLKSAK
jgi:hypothetical protein